MHPARRSVKLWLPTDEAAQDKERQGNGKQPAAEEGEDDDLDKLLQQYEAQAEEDKRKVLGTAKEKPASQMGMAELRETGMAKPLAADNKGYQLLAKMGHREGEGIGKSVKGRAAPIEVSLKPGRTGLGIDEERKRRKDSLKAQQADRDAKRQRGHEMMRHGYVSSRAASFAERQDERRLADARTVCETLDRRKGMTESVMWPPPPPEPAADEAQAEAEEAREVNPWEDRPAAEKLNDVLLWLRSEHFYCVYCGCQYADAVELDAQCPGLADDAH